MEIVNIGQLENLNEKFAVAIGFFDGLHLGHQVVINHAIHYAKENHIKSVVMTFDRSPKVALGHAETEGYLTPADDKMRLLEEMGVDYALILKFDHTFLNLTADLFINEYLLKIDTCYVSVGFDFRFGQGGKGSPAMLLTHDVFKVEVSEPVLMDGEKVSTTGVKKCLKMEDLETVKKMLGRPFLISGKVVQGRQLGRTIGFPTANLQLTDDYLFPLRGVYATASYIDGIRFMSMTNIGFNPTANLQESISIETYIFDFNADIYEKVLKIEFLSKIRDEIKFNGLDELVAQLEKDKQAVKSMSIYE